MRRFLTVALLLSLLTGCANLSALLPTPEPVITATNTTVPDTPTVTPVSPTSTPGGPRILRIWVPPQFDPYSGKPAGAVFKLRLDEFVSRHADLKIDVRVKADGGPSGMINALATTKSAAPSVMPDLVALSRPDLESAAAKGLLRPLDKLTNLANESDWYPYAHQMARIQNSVFGLPFAGDALALVGFRAPLPSVWSDMPQETIFLFPAADQQALFTLSLYLSAGGRLQDNQGQFVLDKEILTNVLTLYLPDKINDFISPQVTGYETDDQTWNAFREQRGNLVVNWTSRYLSSEPDQLALAPLPGLESGQYTLATGWSWALSSSVPENEALAVELAEFLSDSQFLADWTQATGYLPTRPAALAAWEDAALQVVLDQTAESANLIPNEEVLGTVGPLLSQAVISVLNGEQDPAAAVQAMLEQLQ